VAGVRDIGINAGIFQGQVQQKPWIFSPEQFGDSNSQLSFSISQPQNWIQQISSG
jgi:hypothetical protein